MNDRKILIAGNWKMNCLAADGAALAATISDRYRQVANPKCEILIAPPFTLLSHIKNVLQNSGILLSAQDCHFDEYGAHTGDVSPTMLKDVGCKFVILGHSERRTDHNETDELVKKKAEQAIKQGLKIIICIGETEAERDAGRTLEVVGTQLSGSLPASATSANTVIAYEPVWAIGTGKSATTDDVAAVHREIRAKLADIRDKDTAAGMRILYGGSVKASNAAELLALDDVDGALIGGASLKADEFWTIAANCL